MSAACRSWCPLSTAALPSNQLAPVLRGGGLLTRIVSANKAPGGYGLGQVAYGPTFDGKPYNADGITGSGFFSCKNGTPVEDWGTILHIQGDSTTRATQWFKPAFNWSGKLNITKDTVFKRERFESTWEPWEYINPPMELGIEYRTTDRYLGKPVYCMVVDCGTVPAVGSSKTIMVAPDAEIFSVSAYSPMRGLGIPFRDANGVKLEINQSGNTLIFSNYSETLSDTNARASVEYIKTTV